MRAAKVVQPSAITIASAKHAATIAQRKTPVWSRDLFTALLAHQFLDFRNLAGKRRAEVDRAVLRHQQRVFDADTDVLLRKIDPGFNCDHHTRFQGLHDIARIVDIQPYEMT